MDKATKILENCSCINTLGSLQRFAYLFSIHCSSQLKNAPKYFHEGNLPWAVYLLLDALSQLYIVCSIPCS